jgi:hypothetical protein
MDQRHWRQARASLERAVAIVARPGTPRAQASVVRFVLAKELWESGADRGRARALALAALDGAAREGPAIARWLQTHH